MASPEVKVVQPEATPSLDSRRSSIDSVSSQSTSLSSNDDAKTVAEGTRENDDDNASILSMASYPDVMGRRGVTLTSDDFTKTVYEAWEIIYSDDTVDWNTWHVFCGVKLGVKWKSLDDGRLDIDPLTAYSQGELAELHEEAMRKYEAKGRKKGKSYNQDLANRVFGLDLDIYKRLQNLVDDKQKASNRTPYHRREWRVAVFEEGEFQVTDVLPERKKSLFRRRRKDPQVHRWFLILRGEEVKSTKENGGWRLFHRHSNPWWRVDAQEGRSGRLENREHIKKVQQRNQRNMMAGRPMGPGMPHSMVPPMGGPALPPPSLRRH